MYIPRQEPRNVGSSDAVRLSASSRPPVSLLTPAEAAAVLHVDANTLARWSKAGKLSAVRTPGGHRRYLASEVARLVRRPDRSEEARTSRARPTPA